MSCREIEEERPLESGNVCNVVQLQPAAFFAIDDAATRAALVLLAQRIAAHSPKK